MSEVPAPTLSSPRYWPSWLAVGLFRALGMLPYPVLWALGTGLGRLSYYLARSRRRVALRNLEICFPDLSPAERRRMARRHFGYLGEAAFGQGLIWGASRERLERLVRVVGRERIDACVAAGRPVIVLVPHFVGLELGGAAFTALVHSGMYMYQRIRDPVIDAQILRARTRFGGRSIERQDDLRGMVRAIRAGTPFFYLPDQNAGRREGVFVPFCGLAASTVPMLSRFARLTGALVVPTYARYLPRGQGLELIFDPPLDPFPSDDPVADAAQMNRVIEARMRTMPEQYFWVHRRFKTRPPGEPAVYADQGRRGTVDLDGGAAP
jgi:Kdo2-lipid IVA lauroyltransferase/acyltransferase